MAGFETQAGQADRGVVPPRSSARLPGPLIIHIRVVFALLLREARVRHGRSRIGYTWALVEPALLIIVMTVFFSTFALQSTSSVEYALFFATGILPFQYFRNASSYLAGAFDSNQSLFNYPLVKPIDAIIARFVLDTCTVLLVMVMVLTFQVLVLKAPPPRYPAMMLLSVVLFGLLAFGVGLNLAVTRRVMPSISNIYSVIMGPSFFLSCVFYPLSSLPTQYRDLLGWNPLVHGVEGFRLGYYTAYRAPDLDLWYLFAWGLTLTFIGLARERAAKKHQA